MQNIQKHPMVTAKEAATALGIDERTVREKLSKEEWKGEKKLVGMKEKWFMHRGELNRQIERLGLSRPEARVTLQGMEPVFDNSSAIDAEISESFTVEQPSKAEPEDFKNHIVEALWDQLAGKFLEKLEQKDQLIGELRSELSDKDRRLKLLPDLQKQAEDERKAAELKHLEAEALRKQIVALQTEKDQAEQAAQNTSVLESEIVSLKAQMVALQRPWWKKFFG